MALVKCSECKAEISSSAKQCPHCGKKKTSGCAMVAAVFFGIFFCLFMLVTCVGNSARDESNIAAAKFNAEKAEAEKKRIEAMTPEQRKADDEAKAAQALLLENAALRNQGLLWNYSTLKDEMGNGDTTIAKVRSVSEFNFDFPYQGSQRASIILRKHPRHGTDLMFQIEKGQLHCSYRDCYVMIKFDDNPPKRVGASEPSDNSSETYFLDNPKGLISQIKKAKKMKVEFEIFQQGVHVAEFNVDELKW